MKSKLKKINKILLLLLILSSSLYGEENQNSEVSDLDTVVVTAGRISENIKDIPVQVEVITEEEIKNSGAKTAGDLIGNRVTGHYHKYNGMSQPAGLNGFRSDTHGDDIKGHVLILIDGHRLGTGNLAKVPVDIIERVEIIKGPASALYGSAAMGGVVNIITKKGKGKIKTSVDAEYGSFDYKKVSVNSSGSVTDWMSYYVHGSYIAVDDYETVDYGTAYNTKQEEIHSAGNFSFFPGENQKLRLGFLYSDLESNYPEWESYVTNSKFEKDNEDYADKSRGHLDLQYNHNFLDEKLNWQATGYYLWDKNQWYFGDPDTEDSYSKYIDTTKGFDQQLEIKLIPDNKLLVGYTFELLEKESSSKSAGVETVPPTPGLEYITNSVYLYDSLNLLDNRLNLSFGLRYDHFNLKTREAETGNYMSFNDKSEVYSNYSPKAGVSFKLTDNFKLRANVGQGFKTPTPDELSAEYEYDSGWSTTRILGNPDLKPEKSTTYETGFDIFHKFFQMGATYSYTVTKDMIVRANNTVSYDGKDWTTYENIGKTKVQSIGSSIKIQAGKLLDLPVDIDIISNITKNFDYYEDNENKDKLNYISDFESKTNILFKYNIFSMNFTHVYIGKQNIQTYDSMYNIIIEEKDPFSFYNMSFNIEAGEYLEIYGSVENITNKHYEWVYGYPMAERNFKAGIKGKF